MLVLSLGDLEVHGTAVMMGWAGGCAASIKLLEAPAMIASIIRNDIEDEVARETSRTIGMDDGGGFVHVRDVFPLKKKGFKQSMYTKMAIVWGKSQF
jgi:hypothetical protein